MNKPQSIQRRRLAVIAALLLTTFHCTAQTFEPGSKAETASLIEPTRRVVKLLDTGEMGAAWDESSKALKDRTGRVMFISGIKGMRAAAGDVQSRKLQGIGFLQDMLDAPKGRYAAAVFETAFSRITVSEKLVFMQEGKTWRLAGYFMHKRFKSGDH